VFTKSVNWCSPSNASQSCVSCTGKQFAIIIQSNHSNNTCRLTATNDVLNIPIMYPKIDSPRKKLYFMTIFILENIAVCHFLLSARELEVLARCSSFPLVLSTG